MQDSEPRIFAGSMIKTRFPDIRNDHTTEPRWQGRVDNARKHIPGSAKHLQASLLLYGLVLLDDGLEVLVNVVAGQDAALALYDGTSARWHFRGRMRECAS